jgi:hypothetical protein
MTSAASFVGGYVPLLVFGAVLVWGVDTLRAALR